MSVGVRKWLPCPIRSDDKAATELMMANSIKSRAHWWWASFFEARPEVVPQVASLALKSGNAVILKGEVRSSPHQPGAGVHLV